MSEDGGNHEGGVMRGRMKWLVGAVVGCAIMLGFSSPARAACPICAKASDESASYPAKAGCTLVRGATNTLLGWTELFRQPVNEVKGGGNVVTGVGKGIGQTVKRTLAGVGEVLTFWTPKVQDSYIHFSHDCPICMGKQQQ